MVLKPCTREMRTCTCNLPTAAKGTFFTITKRINVFVSASTYPTVWALIPNVNPNKKLFNKLTLTLPTRGYE